MKKNILAILAAMALSFYDGSAMEGCSSSNKSKNNRDQNNSNHGSACFCSYCGNCQDGSLIGRRTREDFEAEEAEYDYAMLSSDDEGEGFRNVRQRIEPTPFPMRPEYKRIELEDGTTWWQIPGERWQYPTRSVWSMASDVASSGIRFASNWFSSTNEDTAPFDVATECRDFINSLFYISQDYTFDSAEEGKKHLRNVINDIRHNANITQTIEQLSEMSIQDFPLLSKEQFKTLTQAVELVGAPLLIKVFKDYSALVRVYCGFFMKRCIERMSTSYLTDILDLLLDLHEKTKKSEDDSSLCQLGITLPMYAPFYDSIFSVLNAKDPVVGLWSINTMRRNNVAMSASFIYLLFKTPWAMPFDQFAKVLRNMTLPRQREGFEEQLREFEAHFNDISLFSVAWDVSALAQILFKIASTEVGRAVVSHVGLNGMIPTGTSQTDALSNLNELLAELPSVPDRSNGNNNSNGYDD